MNVYPPTRQGLVKAREDHERLGTDAEVPPEKVERRGERDPAAVIRELREQVVKLENDLAQALQELDGYYQTYGPLND